MGVEDKKARDSGPGRWRLLWVVVFSCLTCGEEGGDQGDDAEVVDDPSGGPSTGLGDDDGVAAGEGVGLWQGDVPEFAHALHVRPPGEQYGSGDGTTWTDALSGLPAALARGTQYFVAAGAYDVGEAGEYYEMHAFDTPDAEGEYIGIFKATASRHGVDDGWEPALGEGPALFGPISFTTSHYIIDGQSGSLDRGHGIRVTTRDCDNDEAKLVRFPWDSTATNIALRHIDFEHCGERSFTASQDIVYGAVPVERFVIGNCYLHDTNRGHFVMVGWNDVLIDHCYTERNGMQQETHVISATDVSNVVMQHSFLKDTNNSFISLRGAAHFYIYSNVFLFGETPWGEIYSAVESLEAVQDVLVANNTFFRLSGLNTGVRFTEDTTDAYVYNNLFSECETNQIMLTGTHDYNAFFDNWRTEGSTYLLDDRIEEPHVAVLSESPFTDPAIEDFTLRHPTEPGLPLDPPFQEDPLGRIRGEDGVWDRGAFELVE
jgi:hypothetical protein